MPHTYPKRSSYTNDRRYDKDIAVNTKLLVTQWTAKLRRFDGEAAPLLLVAIRGSAPGRVLPTVDDARPKQRCLAGHPRSVSKTGVLTATSAEFPPGQPEFLGSHLGYHSPIFAPTPPTRESRKSAMLPGLPANEPGGSRTHDLRIKSPLLYQLSYRLRR